MPINITSRTLTPNDPFVKRSQARTPSDMQTLSDIVLIVSVGHVLLGPESDKVAIAYKIDDGSDPILILHCDETKRSCLVSAPEGLLLSQDYDAQLAYITQNTMNATIHALVVHRVAVDPLDWAFCTWNLRISAERLVCGLQLKVDTYEVTTQVSGLLLGRGTGNLCCLLASPDAAFNDAWWPRPGLELFFTLMWASCTALQAAVGA